MGIQPRGHFSLSHSPPGSPGLPSHRGTCFTCFSMNLLWGKLVYLECLKPKPTAAVFLPCRNHSLFLTQHWTFTARSFCLSWGSTDLVGPEVDYQSFPGSHSGLVLLGGVIAGVWERKCKCAHPVGSVRCHLLAETDQCLCRQSCLFI